MPWSAACRTQERQERAATFGAASRQRLTNEDIGRLVLALVSGAPGRQLAEQHGIK
jgi:hypothetical protein